MSFNKSEKVKGKKIFGLTQEKKQDRTNSSQIANLKREEQINLAFDSYSSQPENKRNTKIKLGKIKGKIVDMKDKAIDSCANIVDGVVKINKEISVEPKVRNSEFELNIELKKDNSILRKNTLTITMFEGYFFYEIIGANGVHYEGDIYSSDINYQIKSTTKIEEIKMSLEALGLIMIILQNKGHFPKHKSLEQTVDEIAVEDPDILNDVIEVNAALRASVVQNMALLNTKVAEENLYPPEDLPPILNLGSPEDLPPILDRGPPGDLPPILDLGSPEDLIPTLNLVTPHDLPTKYVEEILPRIDFQDDVTKLPPADIHKVITKSPKDVLTKVQQSTSENRINLMEQQRKYDELLQQFEDIKAGLIVKEKKKPGQYTDVILAAQTLFVTLESNKVFFDNPTVNTFSEFKLNCDSAIKLAEIEFQNYRGIWNKIYPIMRGILGIIATITLVPALIVSVTSKYGYAQTFFGTPKTDSAIQLDMIKKKQEEIEHEIEIKLGCVTL